MSELRTGLVHAMMGLAAKPIIGWLLHFTIGAVLWGMSFALLHEARALVAREAAVCASLVSLQLASRFQWPSKHEKQHHHHSLADRHSPARRGRRLLRIRLAASIHA
ncbi:MAG: hypothetical protein ABIO49_04600 [Dokdonella sp.]